MTHVGSAPAVSTSASPPANGPYVEWGPVFAGALLAAALSFVLLTFGTAIGLSAASPWPNSGLPTKAIASLAVFWAVVQQIGAFMAGGYVAGRMRSRWQNATEHEAEFRDGLHGGLVWAVGVVIGAALFMTAAGAAARTGAEVAGTAAASASTSGAMEAVLDTMLRPATVAQATSAPQPGAATAPPRPRAPAATATTADDMRAEMSRILAAAVANGALSDPDRAYLVQLVAQRAGISPLDAEKRVNDAFKSAREAVDKARRATILTGLVAAVSLVVSFGAAWWAAMKGGQHRDNSVPARFAFARRPRATEAR
jgi:hypothetical protein